MPDAISVYGLTAVFALATAFLTSTPAYPKPHHAPLPIPVSHDSHSYHRPRPTHQRLRPELTFQNPPTTIPSASIITASPLKVLLPRLRRLGLHRRDILTPVASSTASARRTRTSRRTRLSFEFYGGCPALDILQTGRSNGTTAPREIIRHQDLCAVGKITAVEQSLQLATIFGRWNTPRWRWKLSPSKTLLEPWPTPTPTPTLLSVYMWTTRRRDHHHDDDDASPGQGTGFPQSTKCDLICSKV
ncbi:hypothetical protein N7532_011696 [Penicillium argentinense]|uniref:Uncharacterized protein n=1 Tax=Penicillium argentinense TaxID=1131581 RepID=A0A9W9EIV7_9EURO|nr:uncharacterized protein N7532_011696 [Penicillium argentinense]KAJ5082653.1 hypothetical protein N7532_011696 [Penicillium argentinense]